MLIAKQKDGKGGICMICSYCGYYCEDGVRFCPSCGNQTAAEESGFVPLNTVPETAPQAPLSPNEELQRLADEKTVKTYKGLLVFSLFLALLLVAGAVYLVAFMPEKKEEPIIEEPVASEVVLAPNVGSWASEDGFIILTASGKFAADDLSGTYSMDDKTMVFDCGDEVIIAEYSLDDDTLTLVVSSLGNDIGYTYYKVSERTDLSYSKIEEMRQEMNG